MPYVCGACGEYYNELSKHLRYNPSCIPELIDASDSESDEEDYREEDLPLAARFASDVRREVVANDLHDLRFEHGLDNKGVAFLKGAANRWTEGAAEQREAALRPLLRAGVSKADVLDALRVDLFAGLETEKQAGIPNPTTTTTAAATTPAIPPDRSLPT